MRKLFWALISNFREARYSLRRGDYWIMLFMGGGALVFGILMLMPGETVGAYPVYKKLAIIGDPVLGVISILVGFAVMIAKTPDQRRWASLSMCAMWASMFFAILTGTIEHAIQFEVGLSAAILHYAGWSILAFLSSVRQSALIAPIQDDA